MSYRRPYTRQFYSDAFHVGSVPFPKTPPERCPEHRDPATGKSRGFRAISSLSLLRDDRGLWRLVAPLDIPTEMPGTNPKLTLLSVKGMFKIGFGTIGQWREAKIGLEADGSAMLPDTPISANKDSWNINDITLNIPLTGYSKLNIRLWQAVTTVTGYIALHNADIILSGEYYVEIPPQTADVDITVLNKTTGGAVKNAHATIMAGAVVIADGYTNSSGLVSFTNIEEGTYTLKTSASGYHPAEQSIDVISPKVAYILELAPVAAPPLPWWVLPVAVGTVALGTVTVIPAVLKKPRPPFIIMK